MPKIATILVPIDIAQLEAADAAVALARDVAETHGARLVLLNVVERVPGFVASQLPKSFHEKALAEGKARLGEMAVRHGLGDGAEIVVRDGHPSTEILEYAQQIGADLIAIASHDPDLSDYFLGSVAARVVRHAHCSVLVVRPSDD
ncbi:MAG: universal stress protein [Rhodospirillales bacterium]|nr:MAG: universal stress protein [Rhodospirillales bacterium]